MIGLGHCFSPAAVALLQGPGRPPGAALAMNGAERFGHARTVRDVYGTWRGYPGCLLTPSPGVPPLSPRPESLASTHSSCYAMPWRAGLSTGGPVVQIRCTVVVVKKRPPGHPSEGVGRIHSAPPYISAISALRPLSLGGSATDGGVLRTAAGDVTLEERGRLERLLEASLAIRSQPPGS